MHFIPKRVSKKYALPMASWWAKAQQDENLPIRNINLKEYGTQCWFEYYMPLKMTKLEEMHKSFTGFV